MSELVINDITRSFGSLVAVDEVSMELEKGEVRGLIGPNGAGKTTLFNCITGTLSPNSGEIRLQGTPITGLSPHEVTHHGLARSFQIPQLFENLTVFENMYLARLSGETGGFRFDVGRKWRASDDVIADIDALLNEIGLVENRDNPVHSLSHGDKRRLEIGMTIALDASILLLDEPAAGLSISDITNITNFLEDIADDYTILIIEHNMDVIFEVSDQITVLENGQNIFTGAPEEVRNEERVSEVYFGK